MKRIFLIFSLLFSSRQCFAWNIMQEHNGATFAKWSLNGKPVRTDNQRDGMIQASLQFISSSPALTLINFQNNLPSTDEIALSSTVFNAQWDGSSLWAEGLKTKEVKKLLTDKKYIRQKAIEVSREIDNRQSSGLTDSETTDEIQSYKSSRVFLRRQFQKLP